MSSNLAFNKVFFERDAKTEGVLGDPMTDDDPFPTRRRE
jgi:hypothetical protein